MLTESECDQGGTQDRCLGPGVTSKASGQSGSSRKKAKLGTRSQGNSISSWVIRKETSKEPDKITPIDSESQVPVVE